MKPERSHRWLWVGCLLMGLWIWSGCGTVITPVVTPTPTGGAMPPVSSRVTATATLAPAAFLTPIPPTPTLTPAPSPTPVVYYVASGDTLLGVALEYGVTVDALLHANSLDVNDYLHIGQALIIPMQSAEAELSLAAESLGNLILPTPTPQPLELVGVSLRRTAVGGLLCLGAVRNVIGVPVTNLQVQAVLVDAAGNPLAQQTALAAVDYLQPEQRAPFAVTFLDPPAQAADVRVALLRAETISAITEDFVPLTVADLDAGMSGPQYRVGGSLVNESGGPVTLVTVVITLFDAEGLVLGYREAMLENVTTLDPGARAAFSVLLTFQGETPPAAYEALAWATRVR